MNNKILSAVLVIWIASTGFASLSNADDSSSGSIANKFEKKIASMNLTEDQKANMTAAKDLIMKKKSGTDLTEAEQAQLDELKSILPKREGKHWGKRGGKKGMKNLTDEEKTALESMSDEEKTAFFETKKAERQDQKQAKKTVIDKLIAWTALTTDEEVLRNEIAEKMNSNEGKRGGKRGSSENKELIKKLVNGESITVEEKATIVEMQTQRAEREAAKEAIKPLIEKKKAGTELTDDETAQLEAFRSEYKGKKGHGKKGWKRWWNKAYQTIEQ